MATPKNKQTDEAPAEVPTYENAFAVPSNPTPADEPVADEAPKE